MGGRGSRRAFLAVEEIAPWVRSPWKPKLARKTRLGGSLALPIYGQEIAPVELPHAFYIIFFFMLGSCVGSFLNVVVWRLPRVEAVEGDGLFLGLFRSWQALSWPPSHCPKCDKQLQWYDNLPVIGWLKLGGRCRFCKQPISVRYPIIEALVGLLFVFYYVMFFVVGHGPCLHRRMPDGILQFYPASLNIAQHWPIYVLDMMLLSGLLAASLIDAELFIIPIEIPWFIVPFALIEHAVFDRPGWPGALNCSDTSAALAAGVGIGVIVSFVLWYVGILPTSFAEGGPLLDVDRARIAKEATVDETAPEFTPKQIARKCVRKCSSCFRLSCWASPGLC